MSITTEFMSIKPFGRTSYVQITTMNLQITVLF